MQLLCDAKREAVKSKVTRVALIRSLADMTWVASTKMLRISSQALVFSTAEYCAPVWCRSPHANKVDMVINSTLRIISGCLKLTPVFLLPVLAGITPLKLSRQTATLALARKAMSDEQHILHNITTAEVPRSRLKFRQPYNLAAQGSFFLFPIILHTVPGSQHLGETLGRCSGLHDYTALSGTWEVESRAMIYLAGTGLHSTDFSEESDASSLL